MWQQLLLNSIVSTCFLAEANIKENDGIFAFLVKEKYSSWFRNNEYLTDDVKAHNKKFFFSSFLISG